MELFFELLQVSLGQKQHLSVMPNETQWKDIFALAEKHALVGVLFAGVEKELQYEDCQDEKCDVLYEWMGKVTILEQQNKKKLKQVVLLNQLFRDNGYKTCLLKGYSHGRYYPNSYRRVGGDIDLWVQGDRIDVMSFVSSKCRCEKPVYHNVAANFFPDTSVEVHFTPSWMFNLISNKRLQRLFSEKYQDQFDDLIDEVPFAVTTRTFGIFHCLLHILRHLYGSGVGIRQFVDLYYLLNESTEPERVEVMEDMSDLGLEAFVASVMYVEQELLGMRREVLLVCSDSKKGMKLMNEVLRVGDFGRYDSRIPKNNANRVVRAWNHIVRNMGLITICPSEALCTPIWKIWHWCWRKRFQNKHRQLVSETK